MGAWSHPPITNGLEETGSGCVASVTREHKVSGGLELIPCLE